MGNGTASAGNVTGFTFNSSGTTTITYTVALDTTTAAESAAGKPDRRLDQHLRDCGWGGG